MSKKKIIVGILGTTALATGDGAISTVVKTISEMEEKEEEKKIQLKKTKENKISIRNKRESVKSEEDDNLFQNCFVEKIYNNDNSIWELSLVLNKKISLMIIKIFVENHKLDNIATWSEESKSQWKINFIKEAKKIIADIKNNSINLSAKDFDDNAIDGFAHQIWKNFPNFSDFFVDLGMNQKIQITSNITGGYWGEFKFQIIGEKTQLETQEKIPDEINKYFNKKLKDKLFEYATKINKFENQKIKIKGQNNDNVIITFTNNYIFNIIDLINRHFKEKKDEFQNWFIIDIKNSNNNIIPSDELLKKIANQLLENINKYSPLYWKKYIEKNIFIINLKNKNIQQKIILKNYNYVQNSFVEKIYHYNESISGLSLILSKSNLLNVVHLFIKNKKNDFIKETKKIIADIKNNSINLSAKDFDDNAIDAFADMIWKNFSHIYYDLFLNLGNNQQIIIKAYINKNSDELIFVPKIKVIGKIIDLENKNNKEKLILKNHKKILPKENKISNCKYDVVEHSTKSKMKIKISQITLAKINLLFFALENKNDFIENLTKIFKTFPPSYDDTYKLNYEEIKSFSYLIWKNFSYYYNSFLNLKNDESIRITSYAYNNYSESYLKINVFEKYNEIVDKNNDVINWNTFNDRNENKKETKIFKHDQDFDIFNRKKKLDDSEPQPGPSKENLGKIVKEWYLGELPDNLPETILQRLDARNPLLRINELSVENIAETTATIVPIRNSNYYRGEIVVRFHTVQQGLNISNSSENNPIPTSSPSPNANFNDWKTKNIDLKSQMPIPMNFQEKDTWCALAVLENILVNNKNSKIHLSQNQLNEYFLSTGFNVEENGLYLYNFYRFINENYDIHNSLGFSFSYLTLNSNFWYLLSDEQKMLILQNLIWNSLNLNTVVPIHMTNEAIEIGHNVLIIGIEPNEDPFRSLYLIRDPYPEPQNYRRFFLPNGQPNTETVITGKQLFEYLFSANNYKELLINSKIFSEIYLKNYLNNFLNDINFKNNLGNLYKFLPYEVDSILTNHTISVESDIFRNINCFSYEDIMLLLSLFFPELLNLNL